MRYFALLSAGLGLALASCGNNTKSADSDRDTSTGPTPVVNTLPSSALGDTATTELMNLLSSYYNLKDALVASDAAKADAAAGKLMSDAEGFRLVAAQHSNASALQPPLETLQQESEAIVNTSVDSIETKRAHFSKAGDALYALLRAAGLKNGRVYQQYCPMAFNDKGGYWLSAKSEIMNPYLPKQMLHCGEVRDSL